FKSAKDTVPKYFDKAISDIGGRSMGTYSGGDDTHDPKLAYAQGNNVVCNALTSNWQQGKSTQSMLAVTAAADAKDFFELAADWARSTEATPAFGNAETFFKNINTADQFFTQGLSALLEELKKLTLAALSGAQAAVDKALSLLQTMIKGLRELLKSAPYI